MGRILWVLVLAAGCGAAKDYADSSKATEAKVQLAKLERIAREHAATNGELVKGSVGPTPANACCRQPGQKCAPDPADWSGLWQSLDFQLDLPFRFQYSYQSDGKTLTALAVADLDCNGATITFKLEGRVENDQLVSSIQKQ
jgi:hypothetical protein